MKFGSAFFGWLTATGMAVLLTALLAAAGAVFSLSTNTTLSDATGRMSRAWASRRRSCCWCCS
jgi:hypothetical protein